MNATYTPKANVRADHKQGLYVIEHDNGFSCLGFDVCMDRIDRIATELIGRGYSPGIKAPVRGSMETYALLEVLQDALRTACEKDGERAVYDLSPQLTGLEGWRVEVVDTEGDEPRRFIVGKSTGWAPIHLEIARRNSTGGPGARLEYHSVREIERVR